MKLTKTASGKQKLKISKKEWQDIGKKAGWMRSFSIKGFTEPSRSNSFFFPETDIAPYETVKSDVLKEFQEILDNVIKGKTVEEVKEKTEQNIENALSEDFWKWIESSRPKAMYYKSTYDDPESSGYGEGYGKGEFDPERMKEIVDEEFWYDFEGTVKKYMDIDKVIDNWYHDYN